MSCTFLVTPVIAGGFPDILAAAVAAAERLGYRRVDAGASEAAGAAPHASANFGDGEVTLALACDVADQVSVEVDGTLPQVELRRVGQAFMDRVVQEHACRQVVSQLGELGYEVATQAVGADQSLGVTFRRKE